MVKFLCLNAWVRNFDLRHEHGEASKASVALLLLMAQNSPERAAGRRVPETVYVGSTVNRVSHRVSILDGQSLNVPVQL